MALPNLVACSKLRPNFGLETVFPQSYREGARCIKWAKSQDCQCHRIIGMAKMREHESLMARLKMCPWSSGRITHAYQTYNSFASGQSTTMVGALVQESLKRTILSEAVQQQTTCHRLPTVLLSSGRSIISLVGSIIIGGNTQPCISIQLISRASVTCHGRR